MKRIAAIDDDSGFTTHVFEHPNGDTQGIQWPSHERLYVFPCPGCGELIPIVEGESRSSALQSHKEKAGERPYRNPDQ